MTSPHPTRPGWGIFWMVLTGLCFVAVTGLVKYIGDAIPPAQAAFLRYLLGLVFLIPMMGALRAARPTASDLRIFGIRGFAHALGVILWFVAMVKIPVAEVAAMGYLTPIYVTLAAALVLGERLSWRRLTAIGVALLGAVVILRPGFRELGVGHLAMLGTSVMFAISYLLAKVLADRASPTLIVAALSLTVPFGLAPFALLDWVTPTLVDLAWLFAVACFATAGHYTMSLAFRAAPVAVTQPVTFLQLVWATLLGLVMFGEAIDLWVIIGGATIIGAVSYITWREAVLKARATQI